MEYKVSVVTQLSDILKSKRKNINLTQEKMGKKLGVSQRVFARNEAHPEKVKFERILEILAELDMDLIIRDRNVDNASNLSNTEQW